MGRAELTEALRRGLTGAGGGDGTRALSIHGLRGMGGIGKTALALHVAGLMKPEFPDGMVMVSLNGAQDRGSTTTPADPMATMRSIVQKFYPDNRLPDDDDAIKAMYRKELSQRRLLLILDNALDAGQVAPLLPPRPSAAIITSRRVITVRVGMHSHEVGVLPDNEATILARQHAPRLSEAQARDLSVAICGGLPLAIEIAARAIEVDDEAPATLLAALTRRRLEMLARCQREGLANDLAPLTAAISWGYDRLADDTLRERFLELSVFPDSFDTAAAAAIWAAETAVADADAARDTLRSLRRVSLLQKPEKKAHAGSEATPRFVMHDLVRAWAGERLAEHPGLASRAGPLRFRFAAHYLGVLTLSDDLYLQGRVLDGLALFDADDANIEAGFAWVRQEAEATRTSGELGFATALDQRIIAYVNAGVYVLDLRHTPPTRIGWLEAQVAAARRIRDRRAEGNALGNLGLAHAALGDARRAIEFYEQSLVIARAIGDRRGEGSALGNLGNAYAALGDARRAIEFYEQQLVIAREIGDRRGEGNALGSLGNAYLRLGDARRAVEFYEQSLVIAREIGDRRAEGNTLGNLGIAYDALGDARRAIEFYEQQLAITREIGDRGGEGNALGNLGTAYAELGDARRAFTHWQDCAAILDQIGARAGAISIRWNMGVLLAHAGDRAGARPLLQGQIDYLREIGHPRAAAHAEQMAQLLGEA